MPTVYPQITQITQSGNDSHKKGTKGPKENTNQFKVLTQTKVTSKLR